MNAPRPIKAELKDEEWLKVASLQRLFDALERVGAARVAGGAVRDALLCRPVSDVDVATTLPPSTVLRELARAGIKSVPTGLEHGTVTAVVGGDGTAVYQVTTLRRDVETYGRHARVAFTDDWAADAGRRDFTMNALYCDRRGELFDPLGGYDDLAARRVRFVGNPEARIREDYLRILRFFRFNAVFGASGVDEEGLRACVALRQGLDRLSRERVHQELLRLLSADAAVPTVRVMAEYRIFACILPMDVDVGRFARMCAIEEGCGRPADSVLRLAALALRCPADVDRLSESLKLSNDQTDRLAGLMHRPARMSRQLGEPAGRERLYRAGPLAFIDAVLFDWADSHNATDDTHWAQLVGLPRRWKPPRFPLGGSDLLALGAKPGPKMGDLLRRAEDWWVEHDFPEDETVLRQRLETLIADCEKAR